MCDLQQIRTNAEYRQKIVETVWLFWVFVLIGFDNGILGPCLPDLQSWVGVSLEQMSYVFFVQGMGALLGNVLGFALEPRLDRRLLLSLYVLVGSVVNILIPLVSRFAYLLLLFLVQGVTKGQADFGAMSLCNVLWAQNKALPFQFIVVGAGISTFVSPFIAQPFITDVPTASAPSPSSLSCPGHPDSNNKNLSHAMTALRAAKVSEAVSSHINADIKWPFIIVGSVTLPAAVAFFYFYLTKPKWQENVPEEEVTISAQPDDSVREEPSRGSALAVEDVQKPLLSPTASPNTFSRHSRPALLFRVLVILLNLPVFGLLLTFADLLTSVGMAPPLCMTAVEASYFNTVLWGAAMVGRAVSAGILLCVSMELQLLLSSVALVVVGAVLVTFPSSGVVLWFGTAGVALFLTPSMPGFIAWSGDFLPITPFFMNLCLCSAGLGEMVLPFVGGQLMAGFGSWTMMVFALVIMVAMLGLFVFASSVARRVEV